jgi:hypothetical protein
LISDHVNARLHEAEDLMHLILLHVGCDLPLRQSVHLMAEAGGVKCSHVTLHRKMRRVGPFLQELIATMADARDVADTETWAGYTPVVIDGSVVVSPGPSSAGGRLHAVLRIADLCVVGAQVTTTDEGETLRRFAWSPGQLIIADRGYANPVGIAHVAREGANILVRVNRGALPLYDPEDEQIDVLRWVRTLNGNGAHHRLAIVRNDHGDDVRGRIIAKRLPADKVDAAKARVRKEVGDDPNALEMAPWLVVFTTAASDRLTDAQVIDLYRLRWQIELLFKRWKSLCDLDKLPNYRKDTLVAWLSAKLLLFLCAERKAALASGELSPPIHAHSSADRRSSGRRRSRATAASPVAHRFREATVEAHDDHLAHDPHGTDSHVAA